MWVESYKHKKIIVKNIFRKQGKINLRCNGWMTCKTVWIERGKPRRKHKRNKKMV